MDLWVVALAPIFIILIYVYIRDKYEKEPWSLLLKTILAGALITIPILFFENLISSFCSNCQGLQLAAFQSFAVAGFTEELFKYLALFLIIRKNIHFNEQFDGIVYAVFVSLGFAAVENVLYVFQYGYTTGLIRAITAVPGHALFGVVMGFYFGKSLSNSKRKYLILALLMPILFHGFYDFILMSENYILLLLFIPYLIYLWVNGFKKMKYLSNHSRFK